MNYIATEEALAEMVEAYSKFDEWFFDVETRGTRPPRHAKDQPALDTRTNEVYWISFAGPGRADVIPMGHPTGSLLAPAETIKAPISACPDFQRCVPCQDRPSDSLVRKDGQPSLRKVNHVLSARFGKPPKQLSPDVVWPMLRPLFFSSARKIAHNVGFDIKSVSKYYPGEIIPGPFGDTSIATKLQNETHGGSDEAFGGAYRLGPCVERAFGFTYDKSVGKDLSKHPFEVARLYSHHDAKFGWLLWLSTLPSLRREKLMDVLDLENRLIGPVIKMEMAGCPIDVEKFQALAEQLDFRIRQLEKQIEEANGGPINLNAKREVAELVYDKRGHDCLVFTDTGERSTKAKSLEIYAYKNPRLDDPTVEGNIKDPVVAAILEHAQTHKIYSTYIANNLAAVQEFGKIFGEFDQYGARTGRSSSRNPNLQNIPVRRGKQVRELFIAPPGYVMIIADYSQIELRVLAHFTNDPHLRKAYVEGLDLHSITARKAYKIPDDKEVPYEKRALAKNVNFSMAFGATAFTLMTRYEVRTEKEANALIDGFYAAYPRVKPWQDQVVRDCRATYRKPGNGQAYVPPYVRTLSGRKRRLPEIVWPNADETKSARRRAERQAINTMIQGSAADIMKMAMIRLDEMLPPEMQLILSVHDELVVLCPEDRDEEGAKIMQEAMEGVKALSLPLVADVKIATDWSAK